MSAIPTELRLWVDDAADTDTATVDDSQESPEQMFLAEAFRGAPRDFTAEPFTLPWYEQIEHQRYKRQGYWIPKLLEFSRHSGEMVLGLGEGLGTDWVQYASRGAKFIACSPIQDHLDALRKHFNLRGQNARFIHAPPQALPFDASSIDVVCVQGMIGELTRSPYAVDEIYRVLRPGGKVIVVASAKYDASYWANALFPWQRWFRPRRSVRSQAMTGRSIRREFNRFVEHRVYKRHLRRANLPPIWRFYPLPLMERLVGQMLIMKALKPLSSALSFVQLAA